MQSIAPDDVAARAPVLGFGCSAMMGRVGRKASLAALAAAYDAGITFYDTARSYGYGESEELLGEFLRGRRDSVVVSTKFGTLPKAASPFKRVLKPAVRGLLGVFPSARRQMRRQFAAMSSTGHFTVAALHGSLDASLRALRTDYVDFLFLHEAPASVLQQDDLFAALRGLVEAGKVRRFGIASQPEVIEAALAARVPGLQSMQFPCNVSNMGQADGCLRAQGEVFAIANHPFGGAAGIAAGKAALGRIARASKTPPALREKLMPMSDAVFADVVLNAITRDTGVQVVVPSMLRLDHLHANVAAIERSRFSADEVRWLRMAIAGAMTDRGLER